MKFQGFIILPYVRPRILQGSDVYNKLKSLNLIHQLMHFYTQ